MKCYIKLTRDLPGLDDVYVTQMTARRIKGIGPFEFACYPLRDACRSFPSPIAALHAMQRAGYIDNEGEPTEKLTGMGVKDVHFIPEKNFS